MRLRRLLLRLRRLLLRRRPRRRRLPHLRRHGRRCRQYAAGFDQCQLQRNPRRKGQPHAAVQIRKRLQQRKISAGFRFCRPFRQRRLRALRRKARQQQLTRDGEQIVQRLAQVAAGTHQLVDGGEYGGDVLRQQQAQQLQDKAAVHGAQQFADGLRADFLCQRAGALVEQADRIAHTALRLARDQRGGLRLQGDPLRRGDPAQMRGDIFITDAAEIKALAAGKYGQR